MKKLIDITSLEQIKVGDMLTSDGGVSKRKVLAKIDLLVALSYRDEDDAFLGWFALGDLKRYKQEVEDTPWQPKEGETYYYPVVTYGQASWDSDEFYAGNGTDQRRLANGLCFPTPEEATAAAQRMLDVLKPSPLKDEN